MLDISTIVSELRNEADIDFIHLPLIASSAEYDLGLHSQRDIRHYALEIVKGLMTRGVYPGDYGLENVAQGEFQFWLGTVDDHVKRIEAEWIAMNKTPNLAEPICWFALRRDQAA